MNTKDLKKEFENLPNEAKSIFASCIRELNSRINFSPDCKTMLYFFSLLEMVLTPLWKTDEPLEQMSFEQYMLLEIVYKTGVLVGSKGIPDVKNNKIKLSDLTKMVGRN
jgi:hypothetical protein